MSSSSPSESKERGTVERTAKRYRDEGYDVVVHPVGDQVPSFAAGFRPDLIATRGREGVIVEIRANRFALSATPQITRLAEIVDSQPDWRLDVVILEQDPATETAGAEAAEPSDEQLDQMLKAAEELADRGYLPYACIVAWGALEAAMRRLRDEAELYGRTEPKELLSTLYSNGFLTRDQFDRLRATYRIRTQVAHGLVPSNVDPDLVRFLTATARHLAYGEGAVASSI